MPPSARPHDWEAIGHIGDGNEYMVWICRGCGARATTPEYSLPASPPDNSKYGPCKARKKAAPKPKPKPVRKKAPKKEKKHRTAWDIIGGKDGGL